MQDRKLDFPPTTVSEQLIVTSFRCSLLSSGLDEIYEDILLYGVVLTPNNCHWCLCSSSSLGRPSNTPVFCVVVFIPLRLSLNQKSFLFLGNR